MRKQFLFGFLAIAIAITACTTSANPLNLLAKPTETPQVYNNPPPPEPTPLPVPTPTPLPIVRIQEADDVLFRGDFDLALSQYRASFDQAQDDETRAAALYGQGLTHFKNDDWTKSAEVLNIILAEYSDSPRAAYASFLLGEIAAILEQPGQAEGHYARYLERRPGVLNFYVQEKRADALFTAGNYLDAVNVYLAAASDPALTKSPVTIDLKIAKALRAGGDRENAIRQLQTIYDNPASNEYDKSQANLLLGQIYLEMGETEQAYTRFQDSVNNFPNAFDSFTALSALVEAGIPVDELQRGTINYNMGKYGLAVDAFNRYIRSVEQPDGSAYYLLALSLREMEDFDGAFIAFDKVIQSYAGTENFLKAWRAKAYTLWAYQDRFEESAETMLAYVRLYPADSNAPDFLFEAARIYERGKNLQAAGDTWERILNEYPNYSGSYGAIYQAGIASYRMGNYSAALNRFQRSLVLAVTSDAQAASSFWIGKSQNSMGDPNSARVSWETAVQLDPTGYYSERARLILTNQAPLSASNSFDLGYDLTRERQEAVNWMISTFNLPPETDFSSPGPISAESNYQRALEFHRLGMYSQTSREMNALLAANQSNPVELFRLLDPLLELGLNRSAIVTSRQILDLVQLSDAQTLNTPVYFNHIRFGSYFREDVLQAAQNEGIHPFILFSAIRQESLFEGFVESSAGARGVMQIMPATGQEISSQFGWPPNYKADDLYRPMVSIRLGARYLARQRDYFGGDMVAALAAYNAGPGNASIWYNLANGDPDLFLEIIRFEETRRYLRQISEFTAIYSRIYERMP
jgi:soluble lytic murein transglycosylase